MEEFTSHIIRPGTVAIAIAVFIATFFTRRVVENLAPSLAQGTSSASYSSRMQLWWNSVILYAIPVMYGCLMALSKSVWLFGQIDTAGGKVLFGGGVGWFASFLYKIVRKAVMVKVGVDILPDEAPRAEKVNVDSEG